jgi:TPR repeat protein
MVNDPVAIRLMGTRRYREGNYGSAFEHCRKAAESGNVGAHYELSLMYRKGQGVEKDEKKKRHHLEEAAIGGHPTARHNLGWIEWENTRHDRAVKHWIIAANLGYDGSLKLIREFYTRGLVSKEDFAAALRAHQALLLMRRKVSRGTKQK